MYNGPNFACLFPLLSVQVLSPYDLTTAKQFCLIFHPHFPWHFFTSFGTSFRRCRPNTLGRFSLGSLNLISSWLELPGAFQVWLSGDLTNFKRKSCEPSSCCSSTWWTKTVGGSLYLFRSKNRGFLPAIFRFNKLVRKSVDVVA